jgi:hypothetical protein
MLAAWLGRRSRCSVDRCHCFENRMGLERPIATLFIADFKDSRILRKPQPSVGEITCSGGRTSLLKFFKSTKRGISRYSRYSV